MRRVGPIILLFASISFIVVGFWYVICSVLAEHWPTVEGTILNSKIVTHIGKGTHYSADISYRYEVKGSQYLCQRISFGEGSSSLNSAQDIVDRYPEGKQVHVFYWPENPKVAVLESGIHQDPLFLMGVGVVFTVIYLFILMRRT